MRRQSRDARVGRHYREEDRERGNRQADDASLRQHVARARARPVRQAAGLHPRRGRLGRVRQHGDVATLEYESWQVADRKLTLRGRSIGNGGTFPFEEVWNVVMVSKKKLVLQRGGVYKMQKCGRLFFRGRQKTSPLSSGSSSANVSRSSPGCLAGSSACHCRGQASSGTGRTSFGSS